VSTIFFHRKRKTYYTRAYIPRKIRCLLRNRLELWRSLDTTDADVAALRSSQWDTRLHRLFLALKRDGQRMTQTQIDALVDHWLNLAMPTGGVDATRQRLGRTDFSAIFVTQDWQASSDLGTVVITC